MSMLRQYHGPSLLFEYSRDDPPHPEWLRMHVHEQCELLYFISGKACCMIESTAYPMEPHTLLILRPMEAHKMNILENKPYERFVLNFDPELLSEVDPAGRLLQSFMDRPLGQNNAYTPADFGDIAPLKLLQAMSREGLTSEERRTDLLIYLYPLLGQLRLAFDQKRCQNSCSRSGTAAEIVDYINRHLFEELSVMELSQQFFISPSQLERIFKRATGTSIWNYILRKRLAAARQQILHGQSATVASRSCGFKEYSSFYRAYIRTYHLSPQQDQSHPASSIIETV